MDSSVRCTLDLDAPGRQLGRLELPRSSNDAGWSSLWIPAATIANGTGPTALVIGGVHGDEPEGVIAALNLMREVSPDDVSGRLIVIPCLSPEAAQAYTRLWPSGANMNRSFPGSPTGSPDEQLADFLTRFLLPRADVVVDMHSAGKNGMCPAWSEMHLVDDPEQRRRMVDGMLAWTADVSVVYIDIAGSGLLVGEAERQGKVVVSTELGSGAHVTAAVHRVAGRGLRNVLRHFGVLAGAVETRASLGLPETLILRATDEADYLLAPESGHFETFVDLGDRVERGQPVGRIHFLERLDREPETVHARTPGIVCALRAVALTEQGDNVAVVGRPVSRDEIYQ